LGDEPWDLLKPKLETLLADQDKNKQRAAAELLAGVLNGKQLNNVKFCMLTVAGSKHWPQETQDRIWQWFTPYIKKTLGQNMKTETVPIWTSFVEVCDQEFIAKCIHLNELQYMFHHKDPRRLQPLVEHIVEQFNSMDYNGPSSLESIKVLALFRAFYTELGWKFTSWSDSTMERFWREVHSEHDDVSSYL
jgi:proteasome activator subunit 4